MQPAALSFTKVRDTFRQARAFKPRIERSLLCEDGFYSGCAVLKLQKPSWRNSAVPAGADESGIFFSIWVSPDDATRSKANYNIHALKLRKLERYRITSRDLAADFRRAFERVREAWPNVSVDYGPQTLMQGWIEIDAKSFRADVVSLLHRFEELSPIIDNLLEKRVAEAAIDRRAAR